MQQRMNLTFGHITIHFKTFRQILTQTLPYYKFDKKGAYPSLWTAPVSKIIRVLFKQIAKI